MRQPQTISKPQHFSSISITTYKIATELLLENDLFFMQKLK